MPIRPLFSVEGCGIVSGSQRFAGHVLINMAEYDLTSKIGGYLDRHLVFPMLEFLSEKRVSGTWSGRIVDLVTRD